MSNRALRKLHGVKDELSALASNLQLEEEKEDLNSFHVNQKKKATNLFDLLNEGDHSDPSTRNESDEENQVVIPTGAKAKKKIKKKRRQQAVDTENVDLEEEFLLATPPNPSVCTIVKAAPHKNALALDQKCLNPDNELKKIFGSKIVLAGQKKKSRGRTYVKSSWLVAAKANWAQIGKTGLSMSLDHTKDGCFYYKYEHNKEYRQIQYTFWEAVSSLNPANIVAIVNAHPYHIDSLIQLSDICRMSDDTQMATELIARALYLLEAAFHPTFNLATGNCRLEYKQQENRALFLAIFKHMVYIGQRGCYRTALEFCKLLYSLDLDSDPLAVILMIDFYAIKAQEFSWFIDFFHFFEPKKNLSQLPNLAYAISLAYFYHSRLDSSSVQKSNDYLQQALLMFPAVLIPLLDKCSIQADARLAKHAYFSPLNQSSHPPSLNHLIQLYVGRSFHTWKDPDLLPWLERNAHSVMDRIDASAGITAEYEEKRKVRYQGTPRNIYRHILLSDIKDATSTLPPDLAETAVLSFDPLPPVDSVSCYSRPRNTNTSSTQAEGGVLSSFFRSLMPGFNVQEPNNDRAPNPQQQQQLERVDANGQGEVIEGAGANLQRSVTTLVNAMRDLLSSIHLPEIVGQPGDSENDDESD